MRAVVAMPLLFCAAHLSAQSREVQRHELESAEGRLMGFYSSALAFHSLGSAFAPGVDAWSVELGMELGYIPHLSSRQRTAGFDKPEASNLSPILPRPRVTVALPARFILDAAWLPPLKVRDAIANLYGASLRRSFAVGAISLTPRVSFLSGRVEGAITCSETLGAGSLSDQQYYAHVCHASASNDYFDPRHLAADITFAGGPRFLRGGVYATVGVRREWTRFDIGVIDSDGSRDPDHPVLEMDATRAWGAAGIQWDGTSRARYALELSYTPGSLVTARALFGWRLR